MKTTVETTKVPFRTLLFFFIPLGISATLVTISHVIINGTLARAVNPAVVIASYSVAMSLFGIFERCAIILRQTCATLVRDQRSYRFVSRLTKIVLVSILVLSFIIAYTPIGEFMFLKFLGVKEHMLDSTLAVYRVLMFVTIFSGIRCLFQGVIISNLRTKWLTIGMVIRLLFMALLSWVFIQLGWVNHGYIGAIIFLTGMMVEALISFIEGRSIIKSMPEKKADHEITQQSQVNKFYRPLLMASLIAVIISPAINAVLGSSHSAELAIASYAVAFSLLNLLLSFSSYVHQIVINFYEKDPKGVTRFTLFFSLVPFLLLLLISYTSIGTWIFQHIMGVSGELLKQCLIALKFFTIFALCFPWLDYINGILMLKGQTRVMTFSQAGNVVITVSSLLLLVYFFPHGGGFVGSLAQSIGVLTETFIAYVFMRRLLHQPLFHKKNAKAY